jgi:hypothetical protein
LCAGLLVSTFSKSLALILGLLVVGVQVSFQGRGKREERANESSGHPATASISSPTTGCKNMSRASISSPRCKTTWRSRSRSEPRLH